MPKTILVTGATDGIGLDAAKSLTEQGSTVLLHGRNPNKLADVASKFEKPPATFVADLTSLTETRRLADDVIARFGSIDVLINNAGVLKSTDAVLSNGWDIRLMVNTLAPYVLTKALIPHMPPHGRVINLSSAAQAPVDLDAMTSGKPMDAMAAYAQSKRAITLWTAGIARHHPQGPVMLSVNPGSLLATNMVKSGFGVAGNDISIGSDILCQIALDDAFADKTGRYWDNDAGGFDHVDMTQTDDVVAGIEALIRA